MTSQFIGGSRLKSDKPKPRALERSHIWRTRSFLPVLRIASPAGSEYQGSSCDSIHRSVEAALTHPSSEQKRALADRPRRLAAHGPGGDEMAAIGPVPPNARRGPAKAATMKTIPPTPSSKRATSRGKLCNGGVIPSAAVEFPDRS